MLRKHLKYLIWVLSPLLMGCSDDFVENQVSSDNDMLTISLRSSNVTRADSETDDSNNNEDAIKNVLIAIYPNEYGEETEAIAVFKPGDLTLNGTNGSTVVSKKLTPALIQTLFGDTNGSSCKFLAVANLKDTELNAISGKPTIAQLKSLVISSEFSTKKIQDSFVMSGSGTVTYVQNSARDKKAIGNGTLSRTAARISLSISLDPNEITDNEGNVWTPVTSGDNIRVLINRGVAKSKVAQANQPAEEDYYNVALSQAGVVRYLSGTNSGTFSMDVPFYSYPNKWDNTDNEEQNRTTMTLVMRWQRITESGTTTRTFYYQVPVTPNNEIVSNHSYQVNLTVGMLGSLTPDTPVEITNVTYQVVDWGSAPINVDLNDTRYLIVNPNSYEVNNEASFRIPFYSTHEVEITDIQMEYSMFNFYSGTVGQVVDIDVSKNAIDNSNARAAEGEKFCTYAIEYDNTTKQYYVVINHPLKIWTPHNSSGQEVPMTGNASAVDPATASSNISYLTATTDDAFSAFTITVNIKHKDNDSFADAFVITQYPGMYITPKNNPGGSYLSRYYPGSSDSRFNSYPSTTVSLTNYLHDNNTYNYTFRMGSFNYGYAYVNPQVQTTGNYSGYIYNDESLGGLRIYTNPNTNMYVITTTRLGEGSNYVIGDPRSTEIDNTLTGSNTTTGNGSLVSFRSDEAGTWCNAATALYDPGTDGTRRLKYYYPTLETSETQNMIAPKFRIASQYGALGRVRTHVTRDEARRRLATYQEQGCPAGRWRIPTKAELEYMINLQNKGYIPDLFTTGSESGYITAQGAFIVNADGSLTASTATHYYVRGVYDEWYWEQETEYALKPTEDGVYNYTLGDVPRNVERSVNLIKAYNDKLSGK